MLGRLVACFFGFAACLAALLSALLAARMAAFGGKAVLGALMCGALAVAFGACGVALFRAKPGRSKPPEDERKWVEPFE